VKRELVTYRSLGEPDRASLAALLREGGPADAYLTHTLIESGPRGFHGCFEGERLFGALWNRQGALSAAACTPPESATVLAGRLRHRDRWSSVVGPEVPCTAIADALLEGGTPRVHRRQAFMVARRGDDLGPGEPRLEKAQRADVDALVPLVARYRVEDGLARPTDDHRGWIREHLAGRVRGGHLFLVRDGGQIVFTGSFTFLGAAGAGLGGIYTVPEARGRGLAGRATATLARQALEVGPCLTLHVAPDNEAAIRSYRRAGLCAAGSFRLTFR